MWGRREGRRSAAWEAGGKSREGGEEEEGYEQSGGRVSVGKKRERDARVQAEE
jgi:hypothetical protein